MELESNQHVINDVAVSILKLVLRERIELPSTVCNTVALPLDERSILVAEEVFETSNPAYEAFIYPDSPR